MSIKQSNLLFLALVCLALTGCGGNVDLEGKVTFTDGTPVDLGTVCFENGNFLARGTLRTDGTYDVGSLTENDGLPPGTYGVYITGTEKEIGRDGEDSPIFQPTIDAKFANAKTSGLSVTIPSVSGAFDFQVERYVPPNQRR